MSVPFVRVVVLNFNGEPFVHRCLDAVLELDHPVERREVVVVDNASTDGSREEIGKRFGDRVRLVANPRNDGFPANNLALRELDGVDFVALVNSDAFVERDWLSTLLDAAAGSDADVGAWCPKIVLEPRFLEVAMQAPTTSVPGDPRPLGLRVSGIRVAGQERRDDAVFTGGFSGVERGDGEHPWFRWMGASGSVWVPFDPDGPPPEVVELRLSAPTQRKIELDGSVEAVGPEPRWIEVVPSGAARDVLQNVGSRLVDGGFGGDRGFLVPDDGSFDDERDVFAWCGGGVLLRTDYLAEVGLFDERFFLYYEDTDLAWRGLARGWRHRTVPGAVMRHLHAASSGEGSALFQHFVERNRLVMLTKNAPGWLVRRALRGYLNALALFVLRDVVQPLRRLRRPDPTLAVRRIRSLLAWMRMLPVLLVDRRRLRARQVVPDAVITGWSEPQ